MAYTVIAVVMGIILSIIGNFWALLKSIIGNNQDGPVFISNQLMISFEQNSILVFNSNIAGEGGAVYSESNITIKGNSQFIFNDNSAINGWDIACYSKCTFC